MLFRERTYSVLVVSGSEKFSSALTGLLPMTDYWPVTMAGNVNAARRRLLEQSYDIVVINAPLPDEMGTRLAIDICTQSDSAVLLLVKNESFDEIFMKATPYGVCVVGKPTSSQLISHSLQMMQAMRERLRTCREKRVSLEEKMEQLRLVNRAKLLLIQSLELSEEEAHRLIEKQAMDNRISKQEVAQRIIQTYG